MAVIHLTIYKNDQASTLSQAVFSDLECNGV